MSDEPSRANRPGRVDIVLAAVAGLERDADGPRTPRERLAIRDANRMPDRERVR